MVSVGTLMRANSFLYVLLAGARAFAAGTEAYAGSTGPHRGPHRGFFARVFEESGARQTPWMK